MGSQYDNTPGFKWALSKWQFCCFFFILPLGFSWRRPGWKPDVWRLDPEKLSLSKILSPFTHFPINGQNLHGGAFLRSLPHIQNGGTIEGHSYSNIKIVLQDFEIFRVTLLQTYFGTFQAHFNERGGLWASKWSHTSIACLRIEIRLQTKKLWSKCWSYIISEKSFCNSVTSLKIYFKKILSG